MSLNDIFHTAISGLSASQSGLGTVSNNIANANVPGYARTRVSVSTAASQGQVQGVVVGQPERVADSFLENAVYRNGGAMGQSEVTSSYLDRLQALLGAPGSAGGLAERLNAIASAAGAMTGVQGSPQTVGAFTGNIQDAINAMGQVSGDVDDLRRDVETEVGQTVSRVNVLLKQIHSLNDVIARSNPVGGAPGAESSRAAALEELSGLMQVNVRNQTDGRVVIETSSGQTLLDKRLRQLSYPASVDADAQATYPPIDIRFTDDKGNIAASTGESIDSSSVGGKLGGLLDLRDRALPQFKEQLGQLFSGMADSLNKVSNEGTTLPPPPDLTGRPNGLVGADRLGFTGKATFAVLGQDGTLVSKTTVDFDALGPTATIDDAVAAINAGLGSTATAAIDAKGVLSITANTAGNGIAIAQDATAPSDRAGMGFSQFFGMNDVVRSDSSALVPSGLQAGDPHGFAAGQTAEVALRDSSGRLVASYTLSPAAGGSVGDMVNSLNGSDVGNYGVFSLDGEGRIRFAPNSNSAGATITVPVDSTSRAGTGVTFSSMFGMSGNASGLNSAAVREDILNNPGRLPLARLQLDVPVGQKAVGPGDMRGANAFVDQLQSAADFGKDGMTTIDAFSAQLLGRAGSDAAIAQTNYEDASSRRLDAQTRRDNFGGVNIDEELSQMVILQNSYTAAARVVTTASEMYRTLVEMV
ncbi:FlgK family flagellar hook-associated protein [Sphingomonas quercus]|uniref:Flagellar hook-associated protein 1 n=1 Tax=Sphingomonas quercus TaxID=2842451 RepID=A0ABS6BMQ4_9SPHN|nr:flagellar basal body protein [Sphingomonas quercus]